MALSRELLAAVRRLDQYELRRLQIVVRGLLLHADGPPRPEESVPRVTYRQQHVRCGKPSCTACPHGPYWYAFWKEGGRTRKQYVGRHLPGEPLEAVRPDQLPAGDPPAPATGHPPAPATGHASASSARPEPAPRTGHASASSSGRDAESRAGRDAEGH